MQHAQLNIKKRCILKKVEVYFKEFLQFFIIFFYMPFTPNETPSSAVNGQDTAFPIPEYEDWDWEMAMDTYPSGRLRDIDGRLVYMFDYQYEQYLKNLEREEEKV